MLAQGEVGRIPCAWMFSGASVKRGAGRYGEGLANALFRFSNRMGKPSFSPAWRYCVGVLGWAGYLFNLL